MDLNSSKQLIGILEGRDSCSVDEMLGFFAEVSREIELSMGEIGRAHV